MRRKPTELGSLDDAAPNPIARKPVRSGMGPPPAPRELPSVDELMAAIDGPMKPLGGEVTGNAAANLVRGGQSGQGGGGPHPEGLTAVADSPSVGAPVAPTGVRLGNPGGSMTELPMGRGPADAMSGSGGVADLMPMDGGAPPPMEGMGSGGSAPIESMPGTPPPDVWSQLRNNGMGNGQSAGGANPISRQGASSPRRMELAQLLAMLRGGRGVRQ